ncbi:biopolymer transporter ExbD [Hydrogenophaga sp.]|uniref:ExbD/TolR family protein n=1 Tax=Hydrogenophaga sp. TaxID=1904254 RepID=UPI0027338FBC|nr:biopolymer transporter ExbD [Hydrogenophaga sp.]MDP3477996.1 biopolymer transporter ExbD [Hydrogenophaga sp.]
MAFGRLEKPAGHRPMSDINVTPLVDVMLVLLVIFILAAPLMASRLALELPQVEAAGATAVDAPAAFVALSVDAQGQAYWDDQPIDADTLRQRLQAAAKRDPGTELQLRADTAVPYGRVVALIAQAQNAGLSRIGFVADPSAAAPSVPVPAR